MLQVHWLHQVGLSTLKISRHVGWMSPWPRPGDAGPDAGAGGAVAGVVGLRGGRWRSLGSSSSASWTWTWAGLVLGTLLFLGPLMAVRRLHVAAALVLSIGASLRVHRGLVRPTAGWRRGSRWVGAIALVGLIVFSFREWDRVARAEERAWARPSSRAPNLLWIVMDTVRADHMSLYGYGRPTTPQLGRWAAEGINFTSRVRPRRGPCPRT